MSHVWGAWIGASGFEYIFHAYERGEAIPSRPGIYIYGKQDAQGVWSPVYMGQGDLSVCCGDPDLLARIVARGATHIHMRLCSSASERETELADLLERYLNAFEPVGCNVAASGTAVTATAGEPSPVPPPALEQA